MLKNYLKMSFRQLWKNKLFSLLNILGLAVSMSVCLLLIMIVEDQYGYDDFHQNKDQIYRVISGSAEKNIPLKEPERATVAFSLSEKLRLDYEFVENTTRIAQVYSHLRVDEKVFEDHNAGIAVDQEFLNMFDFDWVAGDKRTALLEPRSLVITEESAKKLFPYQDPLEKTIEIVDLGTFTIKGIVPKVPRRSHIQFDYLMSFTTITDGFTEEMRKKVNIYDNDEMWRGYVYLQLEEKTELSNLDRAMDELAIAYSEKDPENHHLFDYQALTDIMPSRELSNEMGVATPKMVLHFLIALGIIIILAACFNYMNLSIARSLKRAKEIGIRKVTGARKRDIVIQFLGEAVLIALLALSIAILMLEFLIPVFYNLDPFVEEVFYLRKSPFLYFVFIGFSICVGLFAGLFPAFNIAAFQPIEAIQQLGNVKVFKRVGIRKFLITVQFTLSLIFILTVIIVLMQQRQVMNTDLGVKIENMLNVYLPKGGYSVFAQQVAQLKGVDEVAGANYALLSGQRAEATVLYNDGKDSLEIFSIIGTKDFRSNLEIELLAGKDFTSRSNPIGEQFILLNETAVKRMGYNRPEDALGQGIVLDTNSLVIIGVVKDFHHHNIWFEPIQPFGIRRAGDYEFTAATLVLKEKELSATVAAVRDLFYEQFPDETINSFFTDQRVYYLSMFFRMGSSIIGFVGFLTIIISCFGLLGMVIYTTEGKVKEIGIRKVLGASEGNIVWQLSKGFILLIGIAILFAIPIVVFGANLWLRNFVIQMQLGPSIFILGVGIILLLGLLTVVSQTYVAAKGNPVDSIRQDA